jgi:CRP-like cAMP-binding protein
MPPKSQSNSNRLLETLPKRDRRQLVNACGAYALVLGEVLHRPMNRLDHIYFPTSGFISLIMTVDDHSSLEVGLVGDEGMCGVPAALGLNVARVRAVVQGAGSALCIDTASFACHLAASKSLAHAMDCYVLVHLTQLAQLAACTRFHLVEARLARWLLMTQDRAHCETFHLTHQLLSLMLGVRRVGITRAAGALQERGLIQYSRGSITVLDRRGLKIAACSCYEADLRSYAQAFR